MALISRISTSAALVAFAGGAAASIIGLGTGTASAAVGDNLADSCLQYSQDGGTTWAGSDIIHWNDITPIPGSHLLQADFKARNNCATPAKLQVYAGNWSVSAGSATLSATLNTTAGDTTTLQSGVGNPGVLINQTKRLTKDQAVDVKLYLGLPVSETEQNADITPDWSLALEEVAPTDPAEGGSTGGGTGSLGSGSLGSGSLSTGSLGTGSLGGTPAGLTLKVHAGDALDSPTVASNVN